MVQPSAPPSVCALAPVVLRYVPAAQLAGVAVPTTQYLPRGQGRHAEEATPLVKELYVPAGQLISSPSGQYLPTLHARQAANSTDPAALYFPGGHFVCAADASGQYEPAGHVVQAVSVEATVPRKVPAAQLVGTVIPASGQRVPAGQYRQSYFDVAPRSSLYVPSKHLVAFSDPLMAYSPGSVNLQSCFSALPSILLYVPASQNM